MTIFMYQVKTRATRAIVQAKQYITLNFDKVSNSQPIMVVYPLLCDGKLDESHFHFFGLGMVARSMYDNLTKMIMEDW
jgi:hypothetical protein